MDNRDTARRVLGNDSAPLSYVVPPTGTPGGRPSIYAALVAEWRANGRTVPTRLDTRRDSSATGLGAAGTSWAVGRWRGPAGTKEPDRGTERSFATTEPVPAVVVPRGLPGPVNLWEWDGVAGHVSVVAPPTTED
ncbi:hypothetical protein ACI3K4_27355 [Streptomyces sp. CSMPJR101]|uniref:hypothetical protein n=1 Tax=Streptomyces sp. CSMPJR101 TaxID=1279378 RepID=UPI003852C1D9